MNTKRFLGTVFCGFFFFFSQSSPKIHRGIGQVCADDKKDKKDEGPVELPTSRDKCPCAANEQCIGGKCYAKG